jgi:hypothetical protein
MGPPIFSYNPKYAPTKNLPKTSRNTPSRASIIFINVDIKILFQCHFGDTPREQRRSTLEALYSFVCQCPACVDDYPLAKDLPKTYEESLSKSNLEIEKIRELDQKHLKIGEELLDAVEDNDLARVERLYCDRLRMAADHQLPNSHMIILSNRSGLMDCHWLRFGNRNYSAKDETFKGAYM